MTSGLRTIIYPVKDLATAKSIFGALFGAEPIMDEPYYVQFNVGGQEIGLDPNGHSQGMTGPIGYHHVADIHETFKKLIAAGAVEQRPVSDVGGRLIATVKDPDNNVIGLLQQLG